MNMTILALPRHSLMGASSRVRSYQYERYLAKEGLVIRWEPLLDTDYLRRLYDQRQRSFSRLASRYFHRLGVLLKKKAPDVIWLEKECWPWAPAFFERILLGTGIPIVVDYDDATFHTYDQHRNPILRAAYKNKIDNVMRHASVVIAGNPYLAERARTAGSRRVEILPSVVDAEKYQPRMYDEQSRLRFGWIGSPGSQHLLEPLLPLLASCLSSEHEFASIGARFKEPAFSNHVVLDWSEELEVSEVSKLDVGLMPVKDAPFERGKCGYKLIQYMACAVPVIASPVGVNTDIVRHGETGFLASTPQEWRQAIDTLKTDSHLRRRMGLAGRALFESKYSLQVAAPKLAQIFSSLKS